MAKPKAAPAAASKSAETIESDVDMNSDNLDEQSSSEESSSEESSSSEEESDEEGQTPAATSARKIGGKKDGKWPAYEPPSGMKALPINVTSASSEFEWNKLAKRSGVELWCMRVPANFKPVRLSNLELNASALKKGVKATTTKPIGTLATSRNSYHLIPSSLPSASSSSAKTTDLPDHVNLEQEPDLRPSLVDSLLPADQVGRGARSAGDTDRDVEREGAVKAELGLDDSKAAGAEEMQGLRLVVPDGRRAGFFLAPIQPTRHFVLQPVVGPTISAENSSTLANPTTSEASGSSPAPKNRHPQPAGLKYRNIPFGAINPNTTHVVGGPGKDGKDTMITPSALGRGRDQGTASVSAISVDVNVATDSPSKKTGEKKKDGKKRKSTGVEDPAVAEKREKEKDKERKRKLDSAGGGKSKRPKTE